MREDEFVEKLAKVAPSVDYLISCGYETIAEEIRNGYILPERSKPIAAEYDDSVARLICNYDTCNFEIGGLRFGRHEYDFPVPSNKIHVGSIEADILVIDPHTGAVELIDHGQPDFVMATCAVSGGRFLEALLHLPGFWPPYPDFNKISESQRVENNRAAGNCAVQCAKMAGISAPPNIYEMLLGYDSRLG